MIIILAYIFYFIAASASPLQRRYLAVKKDREWKDQIRFSFEIMLVLVLAGFLFPLFSPLYFSGNSLNLVILTLVCGVFGAAFWVANYAAQKHIDAAVQNIVANIYTPVTIVLSTLFLGEKLNGWQIVGTALLLVAMIVISNKHRTGTFRFDKYFLLILLSGV